MRDDEPDRLYIRKDDREDYKLVLGRGSPLEGKEAKAAFLLAMLLGYAEDRKQELGTQKEGYVRTEYLTELEESVIKAIAIKEAGSLEVLQDKKKVFSIAENYAAGGIKILKDEVSGEHGSFEKRLELLLSTALEKHPKDRLAKG